MTDDRIQRALDGELPLDQLDPAEAAAYHRFRSALSAALEPLDRVPEIDVAPAVLRRIAEAHPAGPVLKRRSAATRVARWLWAPRPVALTFRPAFGLAAAAIAALAWSFAPPSDPETGPVGSGAVAAAQVMVQFRLGAPGARDVALVGDFNGWRPAHAMHEIAPGVWTVTVALEPGVYDYGFVVDGATLALDPLAPRVSDGFGGESSRVAVLAPEVRS